MKPLTQERIKELRSSDTCRCRIFWLAAWNEAMRYHDTRKTLGMTIEQTYDYFAMLEAY